MDFISISARSGSKVPYARWRVSSRGSHPHRWVDKWLAEGFDIHREPVSEILKRCAKERWRFI